MEHFKMIAYFLTSLHQNHFHKMTTCIFTQRERLQQIMYCRNQFLTKLLVNLFKLFLLIPPHCNPLIFTIMEGEVYPQSKRKLWTLEGVSTQNLLMHHKVLTIFHMIHFHAQNLPYNPSYTKKYKIQQVMEPLAVKMELSHKIRD